MHVIQACEILSKRFGKYCPFAFIQRGWQIRCTHLIHHCYNGRCLTSGYFQLARECGARGLLAFRLNFRAGAPTTARAGWINGQWLHCGTGYNRGSFARFLRRRFLRFGGVGDGWSFLFLAGHNSSVFRGTLL